MYHHILLRALCLLYPSYSYTIYPFTPSGLFYLNILDRSISSKRGIYLVLLLLYFNKEIPVQNANSVDPDQTPRSSASDLGLHCLPTSLLWDSRRKQLTQENLPKLFTTAAERFFLYIKSCFPSGIVSC